MQELKLFVLATILEVLWPEGRAHQKAGTSRKIPKVANIQIFLVSRGRKILTCFLKIVLFLCMATAIHQLN